MKLNPLPDDKISNWSKFKAFADDKIKVTENLKFVLQKAKNIVREEENAAHQHFFLFPQCFQNVSFHGSLNVGIVV